MKGWQRGRILYGSVLVALVALATVIVALRESFGTGAVVALALVNLAIALPLVAAARPKP